MFINKNSVSVNGTSMGQYLVEVKYGYHKLWGSDSGRNLAGVQSGTLVGIFPKLTLQFRRLTKSELEVIAPILDTATQNLTYYDPKKKQSITIQTYTGDYEVIDRYIVNEECKNEGFSCAFISRKKRD